MSQNKKDNKPSSRVPQTSLSRGLKLSGMFGSIAARTALDATSQLFKAQKPSLSRALLSDQNANSIAKRLSEMRGAAMKIGQMISMDAGEFLPESWEPILKRLREGADLMPKTQLLETLNTHWGNNWDSHFKYFSFEPVASASIGQVHKAQLKSGQWLAVKVQYPGVVKSIDSDVNNVGRLLRLSGILPKDFDLDSILLEAKAQLKTEADYEQEAQYIRSFSTHLAEDTRFVVPEIYDPLSNKAILCMSFIEGESLDNVQYRAENERSQIIQHLFDLLLNELFTYGFIQSDPNFANYLYLPQSRQIALLDFGACKSLPKDLSAHYKLIARGMLEQNRQLCEQGLRSLKLIYDRMPEVTQNTIIEATLAAGECLQTSQYNFKSSGLIKRLYAQTETLMRQQREIESPNFDVALVNRKVSGMVLLANKLNCEFALRERVVKHL
uniref:ABC1 kinase family protein n=1 Tax=Ningiella ruwaisensis TaxID=2364274 RepID=UPI00109F6D3F|nr:AarF/ABC1/UbiB kinase family protein [Ningiella ruwaisensis]